MDQRQQALAEQAQRIMEHAQRQICIVHTGSKQVSWT